MAFKTAKAYNDERYGGMFMLRDDGDYADVVILYRNEDDVLVADTHYIKSADYSGYVHCVGKGCPACAKGLRVQPKLFIPVYVLERSGSGDLNQIEFFDRSMRFENQLRQEVFANYPNPCEFVFRITRHGAAGSMDTKYEFRVMGRNNAISYDDIMRKFNTKSPDFFDQICKEFTAQQISDMLTSRADSTSPTMSDIPEYTPTPRVSVAAAPEMPAATVEADLPPFDVEAPAPADTMEIEDTPVF